VSVEINNKTTATAPGAYFNPHVILPHELFKRRKLIKRLLYPNSNKKSSIDSSESEENNTKKHSVLGGEGQVFNAFNSFMPKY
jgi:hypothetical protein